MEEVEPVRAARLLEGEGCAKTIAFVYGKARSPASK
jgi:hypothetical protein